MADFFEALRSASSQPALFPENRSAHIKSKQARSQQHASSVRGTSEISIRCTKCAHIKNVHYVNNVYYVKNIDYVKMMIYHIRANESVGSKRNPPSSPMRRQDARTCRYEGKGKKDVKRCVGRLRGRVGTREKYRDRRP